MLIRFFFIAAIALICAGCAHDHSSLASAPEAVDANPVPPETAWQQKQGQVASGILAPSRAQAQPAQIGGGSGTANAAPNGSFVSGLNSPPPAGSSLSTDSFPRNDNCQQGHDTDASNDCQNGPHHSHPHPHQEHEIENPDEPRNHLGEEKPRPEQVQRVDLKSGFDEQAFLRGIKEWVVSRNSNGIPNKIFIHRAEIGMSLVDLLYNVRVEADGSWTIFDPEGTEVRSFGRRIGSIKRPPSVRIIPCGCV